MRALHVVVLGLLLAATTGCSDTKKVASTAQGINFADYSYMSSLAPAAGSASCTNRMTIAGGLSAKCSQ